jgi:hypothetical protein
VHIALACAVYVCSFFLHFCKRLFAWLEPMTSWSQGNSFTAAPALPLLLMVTLFVFIFEFVLIFQVPHTTFLLTHACFLFYHMASNMTLRRLRHSTTHLPQSIRWLFEAAWIIALSYFIAYLETLAIANVCSSIFLIPFCLLWRCFACCDFINIALRFPLFSTLVLSLFFGSCGFHF